MGLLLDQLSVHAGVVAVQRPRELKVYDSFTQGASLAYLDNHQSDDDQIDFGASWVRHPSSVSGLTLGGAGGLANRVYNDSGSSRALYRHATTPNTCDYRVSGSQIFVGSPQWGNSCGICARMNSTVETYYEAFVDSGPSAGVFVRLNRWVLGELTELVAAQIAGAGADGLRFRPILDCSNDEKVVYVQEWGGEWGPPVRWISSGDNVIPESGSAGLSVLRCSHVGGVHLEDFTLEVNGPQPQSGISQAPTPDPDQAPAVLWTPDYSGGATSVLDPDIWLSEQEPRVRGVEADRITIVDGGSVPGSGPYKPAEALRVELRSFHNANLTVTDTAGATAVAAALTMSSGHAASLAAGDFLYNGRTGEWLRVSSTPAGTNVPVLRGQSTLAQAILNGDTFLVPGGDVNDSGSTYVTSRAELYDRFAAGGGAAAPASWPDPVGSIRWYRVRIFIAADWDVQAELGGANNWCVMDQWKGQFGGSPPRSLEIQPSTETFVLGGTRPRISLGSISRGSWTELIFGFRWETSGLNGWVQVYRNGTLIVPKRFEATMDFKYNNPANGADPCYYKQGIYRHPNITATQVAHFGPTVIATTYESARDAP